MKWVRHIAQITERCKAFKQFLLSQCDRLALDALLHYLKGLKMIYKINSSDFEDMVQASRWNALHNAAKTMREHGGGFAGSMAEAWQKADKTNKTRIEEAFPDLFFRFMGESDRSYFGDKIH